MARPRRKPDLQGQSSRVASLLKAEPPGWRRECLLAVHLGIQGEQILEQIAGANGRSRSSIQEWFDTYRTGGGDALLKDERAHNPGQPGKLSAAAKTELATGLKTGTWRTGHRYAHGST